MKPLRRVLLASDFSPCSDAAAELASQLASQLNAAVELMTVIDVSSVTDASGDPAWRRQRIEGLRQKARDRLQAFADRHLAVLEEVHIHVFDGGLDPPNVAVEVTRAAAALRCDLIVMGTHGKTGLEHVVLGSVTEKVVRASSIPVLTMRAKGR